MSTIFKGFEPRQDRILVKPDVKSATTKGGIIVDAYVQDEILPQGEVMATGPEAIIMIGYKVQYGPHAGFDVIIEGEKYRLIRDSDAYSILHEKISVKNDQV